MKYIVKNTKLFIVLGLLAFAFGCDTASNKTTVNTTANSARPANTPQIPANAPVGAMPPNLLGSPTASVTVEEFADFQCGACASVHTTMKNVQAAYGSRIKFVYRHFPLQMHKNAYDASVAAEAAGQQGKFWDMQNQIFSNQAAWSNSNNVREIFEGYAQNIGLDVEKFKTDMLGMATKTRVDADLQRGRALGISSTPTLFVNGVSVPYQQMTSIDSLKQIIDAELQKSATQSPAAPPAAGSATSSAVNSNANSTGANTNTSKTVTNSGK